MILLTTTNIMRSSTGLQNKSKMEERKGEDEMIDKKKMTNMEYRDWINSKLTINKEMLQLSQEEVKGLGITNEEIIELTELSMIAYSAGEVEMPAKIGIHPLHDTFFHAQPCDYPAVYGCGIKWGACYPENRQRFGYAQTTSQYIYNDRESGAPLCIMDAVWITEIRTAAVAACAAKKLANVKAKTFGMVGCGVQGNAQVMMMQYALPELEEIYILDNYEPAMDALIERQQPNTKAKIIKAKSYEEIARKCEVICSAAIIKEQPDPQFKDEWFRKGVTIISSDAHTAYEDATVKRADKYLLDSIAQHELLAGIGYYPDGLPKVYGETGEALGGMKPGRENDDEFIFVNNIGMGCEDVIVAAKIFETALEKGVGRKFIL